MVAALDDAVCLQKDLTIFHVSVHEDNAEALILAENLLPQYTSQSNHYAMKTIWLHEEIFQIRTKLVKIKTVEQIGDVFTKALPRVTFEYL